jgi:hypothetical protein
LIDRIIGVSPCHPQATTGLAVLIETYDPSHLQPQERRQACTRRSRPAAPECFDM